MSRSIQVHNHPFRFLLYLEWVLLLLAALSEFLPHGSHRFPGSPLLTILSIVGFGVMGLRMPVENRVYKLVYTAIEIFIILSITFGGRIRLFSFLYIVLVIRSCLIFKLLGRIGVTALAFTCFLLTFLLRLQNLSIQIFQQERFQFVLLSYPLLFGLSLMFAFLLMNALLAERQSRDKLAIANEQLRQYALRIEDQATLQERNRIARELHDSLGHSLTALNLQLETAIKLWSTNPDKATQFLAQAKRLGSTALQDVRHSVSTMRSNPLQGRSLEEAITSLTQEFYRSTGISPTCNIVLPCPIPFEVMTAVYRIVQEALTNISKYANATEVNIQLQASPTQLDVMIQDNGKGFNVNQNTTGFGLQGMQERSLALGGQFKINSSLGTGCKITAKFTLLRL